MSTSNPAVRPIMSAPTPRAGSSGRCGSSGSSPTTTAAASAGAAPGSEPTPVAAPAAQRSGRGAGVSGRSSAPGITSGPPAVVPGVLPARPAAASAASMSGSVLTGQVYQPPVASFRPVPRVEQAVHGEHREAGRQEEQQTRPERLVGQRPDPGVQPDRRRRVELHGGRGEQEAGGASRDAEGDPAHRAEHGDR